MLPVIPSRKEDRAGPGKGGKKTSEIEQSVCAQPEQLLVCDQKGDALNAKELRFIFRM